MKYRTLLKRTLIGMALAVLVLSTIMALPGCSGGGSSTARIGEKAPDFQLKDLDGELHSLSDYEGSPVLLNFWATWCGPCRSEMPHLQEVYVEWQEQGLVMLAVNVAEALPSVTAYIDSFGFTMPVLLDTARSASTKYRVEAIPTTYFIDADGIIQDRVFGAFPDKESIEEYLIDLVP